jgi:Mg2+ and Co2+ transporter CorA
MSRTTMTTRSKQQPDLATLQTRIESRLRKLLREHRRRLGAVTIEDAQKEERELKRIQSDLVKVENQLKGDDPDQKKTQDFEDAIKKWQGGIKDLEDKIDLLINQAWPPPEFNITPDPEFVQEVIELIRSFEDVLHGNTKLLQSFEDLLHRFPPPPPGPLLGSFSRMLQKLIELLKSFAKQVNGALGEDFTESFWELLRDLERLLKSFEDLIKTEQPTNVFLLFDFDDMIEGLEELLTKFEMEVKAKLPHGEDLGKEDETLITRFENLLHGLEELLNSLEGLVNEHAPQAPIYIRSFESHLKNLEELLDSFETILKDYAPKNKEFIQSFEKLLRELAERLNSFEDLIKNHQPQNPQLIKSFEELLHGFEARLESMEDLVRNAPDEELVLSFEDLLHRLGKLLESFDKLRKGVPDPMGELSKSNKELMEGLKDLIASLQDLKKKLDKPSDALLRSDQSIIETYQARQDDLLASRAPVSPEEAEDLVASIVGSEKLLIDLLPIILSKKRRRADINATTERLVAKQRHLVTKVYELIQGVDQPSIYLRDALEDLQWLQGQLETRTRQLD